MESGGGESNGRRNMNMQLNNAQDMSKITLNKIKILHQRRRKRDGTTVTYHDMRSAGYGWLLPGWIAEERRLSSGKVYKYYYDPDGCIYKTRCKVLATFEEWGIIVLDT